ncbi:hypothetical protein V6N13_109862 [Hibiscus sabdariffa]
MTCNNGSLLVASKDGVGWKLRADLRFSIKSAYAVCCGAMVGVNEDLWKGPSYSTSIRMQGREGVGIINMVAAIDLFADRSWLRPEKGWIKLNTDGSCENVKGHATYGGVERCALDYGAHNIAFESDCVEVVRLLSLGSNHISHMPILLHIWDILRNLEGVWFIHVFRECNKVTNRLCTYASSVDFEIHILESPTDELDELLLADNG